MPQLLKHLSVGEGRVFFTQTWPATLSQGNPGSQGKMVRESLLPSLPSPRYPQTLQSQEQRPPHLLLETCPIDLSLCLTLAVLLMKAQEMGSHPSLCPYTLPALDLAGVPRRMGGQ